ncbi:MAG: glycosyltransferase [Gammaproteobacteria bacterium]|nr:glycosyltransferase [Gammaproteobacteria bacterium]
MSAAVPKHETSGPTKQREPALSVVLATEGDARLIAKTLKHLLAQTIVRQLELVIVASHPERLGLTSSELSAFGFHQLVSLDALRSKAQANTAGLRQARANVVAFAEDHCFPEPDWAAALLQRHDEPWAAVGPTIRNANPGTVTSWCDLILDYQPWLNPTAGGPVDCLPGHNSSYKKSALKNYEDRLERWLEVETELHLNMTRDGLALYLEPKAGVAHVNFSRVSAWLQKLYYSGRVYADERRRTWGVVRRIFYVMAASCIPVVRLARILTAWPGAAADIPSPLRLLPCLLLGLIADGAGQMIGYLLGAKSAATRMVDFEFNRGRYVRDQESAILYGDVQ